MTAEPKPAADLYALPPDAVREPPASLGRALLKIGPGLILAGSIVGTGELIATTHLGAKVGIGLLWLVLLSCFIKVFVQVELGRHAISSGETILTSLNKLPGAGKFFLWWWLLMMLGTQTQLSAMVGGVGQAIHLVVPEVAPAVAALLGKGSTLGTYLAGHPDVFWGTIVAVATSVILAIGSYRLVERGTTLMVVAFTLMTVVCVAFLPRGSITANDLAKGMSFQIPEVTGAAMFAFAMFGITGVGAAELIAYPYWCIEKGYARSVGLRNESPEWERRAKGWMRVMYLDAWVSMLIYTAATLAFYLLGAAILHPKTRGEGLPNAIPGMLNMLAEMYVPMMGQSGAIWFIVIGAFVVLYSTLFSATAANSRATADFMQLNGFVSFTVAEDRARWVRRLCIAFPILDLALYTCVGKPVALVTIGAIGQALTLPMIAVTALYLRYRRTDARLKPGRVWDLFLILSLIGFCVAAGYTLLDTYRNVMK